MTGRPVIFEPFAIVDSFATNLVKVERVGPCTRLWFAAEQASTSSDDDLPAALGERPVHVIVAKVVIPTEALEQIARQLLSDPAEAVGRAPAPRSRAMN